jgi:hypothetical protein
MYIYIYKHATTIIFSAHMNIHVHMFTHFPGQYSDQKQQLKKYSTHVRKYVQINIYMISKHSEISISALHTNVTTRYGTNAKQINGTHASTLPVGHMNHRTMPCLGDDTP